MSGSFLNSPTATGLSPHFRDKIRGILSKNGAADLVAHPTLESKIKDCAELKKGLAAARGWRTKVSRSA
jgi:hypothetical protein